MPRSTACAALIAALALAATSALAAPAISSVSGTLSHGASLTISGSGFGAHDDYGGTESFLCNGWTDFESGTLNGGNFTCTNPAVWQIVTSNTRANSSYHARKYYNGTRLGEVTVYTKPDTHEFYSSFWIMLTQPTTGGDGGKIWRIWSDIHEDNIWLATGGDNTMIRGASESQRVSGSTQWSSPSSIGYGQWHRIEIWMDDSPSEFTVWMDCVFQWTHDDWVPTPWYSGTHTWAFGHMINDNDGGHNFDDAYFSNTRARVEIGNAGTWSACTHRETQIPTAWSSSSITVTVNRGSFGDLAQQYLYVVDSSGAVNQQGYPLSAPTYALTVNSGTGDGQYAAGTVVAIAADDAPSGWRFDSWTGDTAGIADANDASTTITMPADDAEVTATYVRVYVLTVNSGTGDGQYRQNEVVAISADGPPTGWQFDSWTGDTAGIADVESADTTVTMPAADVEVTAGYKEILWGDLNGDGFVGQTDLDIVLDNWGLPIPPADPRADPSGDDFVGQVDLDYVLDHWGEGTLP